MKNLFILLTFLLVLPSSISAQSFLDKVLKGVEKTNKILDETDKMLGTDGSSQSSSPRRKVSGFQIVSPHPDIEIQFKRCVVSGSTAILDLVITNYGKDVNLQLGGRSNKVFDDLGNQYPQTQVSIADGKMYEWKSALFPTDVPLKFRLQIYDISSQATLFKRIDLNIYSKNINFGDPIFLYNVPITRKDNSVKIVSEEEESSIGELSAPTSTVVPASSSPCFRHPLIDPLIATSDPPSIKIADVRYIDNDWNKLGLKGHVKQITETIVSGNKDNAPNQNTYIFLEDGMLGSIDISDQMYLFTYQNNKLAKILLYDKKKNTTSEYDSPFSKDLHFNEQGQLMKDSFGLVTTYSYDELGACSKITFEDDYPDNIAVVTSTFTRNSQGDICNIHTETIFYEQKRDSKGNFTKGKKEDTTQETCLVEYQYDKQGNWTSMLADKCPTRYIHSKRIIEYYD